MDGFKTRSNGRDIGSEFGESGVIRAVAAAHTLSSSGTSTNRIHRKGVHSPSAMRETLMMSKRVNAVAEEVRASLAGTS